ncbi:MAG: carboxypeptidase regulatory-like domain-containing protein [Gemmatimonadota bacterium]
MKKRLLLVMLAVAACGGGGGGGPADPPTTLTGTVRGTVRDDLGASVTGATVQLSATGKATKSATTGSDGVYSFSNVEVGVWQIVVLPPSGFTGGSTPTVTVAANQQANAPVIILTKVQAGGAPASVDVSMVNTSFVPSVATVKQGGTVRWRNNDPIAHTATGSGFDTGSLAAGATSTKAFNVAGTINYECTFHPGMTGRVVVVQ